MMFLQESMPLEMYLMELKNVVDPYRGNLITRNLIILTTFGNKHVSECFPLVEAKNNNGVCLQLYIKTAERRLLMQIGMCLEPGIISAVFSPVLI